MGNTELTAAAITDQRLRDSYEKCRQLTAHHGKTYYLATKLLPPEKRPFVHALYALARCADDIVDSVEHTTVRQRQGALAAFAATFFHDLDRGFSWDPIGAAAVDTAIRWQIPREDFVAFFRSMRMDLSVDHYDTYDDLYEYVYGSAAVIGRQLIPILEPTSDRAAEYAVHLGIAFQFANFIRDIGEDLDRGRIYLPLDELARFNVTPTDLKRRAVTPELKAALEFQVARVHDLEQKSRPGIAMLRPDCQPGINAARILYCEIADEVVHNDYQVFDLRASVSLNRRLRVVVPAWVAARRARRRYPTNPKAAPPNP